MSIGARMPFVGTSEQSLPNVDFRAPALRLGEAGPAHSALCSTIVAYGALVALLRGPCDGVEVAGEVVLAGDGVVEVRGRTRGEPGRVVICRGLIPGGEGPHVMVGGMAGDGPGEDGGNVTLWWVRDGKDAPVLRILGARAPLDTAPQAEP